MFNWVFNRFYFLWASPEVTSVWGVSVVAILDSSVNCVCVWSTKKLTMPAYCVAANCNNLQMTPGITMHELLRNRPAVRRKWTKFIQFKWADFLAVPHHAHLCSEHFSECDFANPMENRMGFCFEADTMFQYSFKILPDRLKLIWLYPCGSLWQCQFRLRSLSWPFCSDSPEWHSRHTVTWFGRHGDTFGTTENAFFSCIYNPQITVSPTSSFSVCCNGNRVKNHPIPWTCPLISSDLCLHV